MTTPETVIWPLKPHTEAKHEILRNYFNAWFPILGRSASTLNYVDGFAGPGEYAAGEDGSPVITVQSAIDHDLRPDGSINFVFIEKHPARASHLEALLADRFPDLPQDWDYHVLEDEFDDVMNEAIDRIEEDDNRLAPTLAFIDPFGFKGLPLTTIDRILQFPKCEVIVTFMADSMNRFADDLRADTLDRLFGTGEWRAVNDLEGAEKSSEFLVDLYQKQLREETNAHHVRSFEMRDEDDRIIYYLVYATQHPKGLEVMKEAMWSVDPRGSYRFSDRTDEGQTYLMTYTEEEEDEWVEIAAQMVYDEFVGQSASREEIERWVVVNTPYLYRMPILKRLEDEGKIERVEGRKGNWGYPPGSTVHFT